MRIHTTAVPATKYLPERVHVKFTDDSGIPDNITDKTFIQPNEIDADHDLAAYRFLVAHKMSEREVRKLGPTLTHKGYVYQISEA